MRRVFLIILTLSLAIAPWGPGGAVEQPGVIPDFLISNSTTQKLREVVEGASYVDEKKGTVFRGHREVYEYLLNHLDFASRLGRIMDLTDYVIEETGQGTYKATTPKGAWAYLQVVYADDEKRVVLAEGKYGRAVVVLTYDAFDREGESYIKYDLYGYVRADNPILHLLLGLFGGIVNHRIEHVLTSVAELNERIYEAPGTFQQELLAQTELPPDHLSEFAHILTQR
ncbi:MAG: hypothetical protein ACE5JQ_05215 [Candidatus Methylomirabilales bacterium]